MRHWDRAAPHCHHPERYTARDRYATEDQVLDLLWGYVRGLQPAYVVEVGSYLGDASAAMARALQQNGHGHLDTIELNVDYAKHAHRKLEGLPATVYVDDFGEWEPPPGRPPIEFAWIDGPMSLRAAHAQRVIPWCAKGAILGLHDTSPAYRHGRRQAEGLGLRLIQLRTLRGVAFAEVPT